MSWYKSNERKELEADIQFENILHEISNSIGQLDENRATVLESGKEAVKLGEDELMALSASGLREIDLSRLQLMKAKTTIELMHAQGITAKTMTPFFAAVKGLSDQVAQMGVKDASKARAELKKASQKMRDFDTICRTAIKSVSDSSKANLRNPELQVYVEEIKAKARADEEKKMPMEIEAAKMGIEQTKAALRGTA
jgi:hypothetical protein